MMMVVMPLAMAVILFAAIPIADDCRRLIVPRGRVVAGRYVIARRNIVPGRRGDISRRRRYHDHSRQSDSDRPIGSVRAGRKRRSCETKADYSAQ